MAKETVDIRQESALIPPYPSEERGWRFRLAGILLNSEVSEWAQLIVGRRNTVLRDSDTQ